MSAADSGTVVIRRSWLVKEYVTLMVACKNGTILMPKAVFPENMSLFKLCFIDPAISDGTLTTSYGNSMVLDIVDDAAGARQQQGLVATGSGVSITIGPTPIGNTYKGDIGKRLQGVVRSLGFDEAATSFFNRYGLNVSMLPANKMLRISFVGFPPCDGYHLMACKLWRIIEEDASGKLTSFPRRVQTEYVQPPQQQQPQENAFLAPSAAAASSQ